MSGQGPRWDGARVWALRVKLGGGNQRSPLGLNAFAERLKAEARERFGYEMSSAGSTVARWEDSTVEPPYVAALVMAEMAGEPFDVFALGPKPWGAVERLEERQTAARAKLRRSLDKLKADKKQKGKHANSHSANGR